MVNPLEVGYLVVSEPLIASAEAAGYVSTGGPKRAVFSEAGSLVGIGNLEFLSSTCAAPLRDNKELAQGH